MNYKYPRTTTVRGKALRKDKRVLKDGVSVGKGLVIFRGITQKETNGRLLN